MVMLPTINKEIYGLWSSNIQSLLESHQIISLRLTWNLFTVLKYLGINTHTEIISRNVTFWGQCKRRIYQHPSLTQISRDMVRPLHQFQFINRFEILERTRQWLCSKIRDFTRFEFNMNIRVLSYITTPLLSKYNYRQTSNIKCILVGDNIVDPSDIFGASTVGAALTTSSISI